MPPNPSDMDKLIIRIPGAPASEIELKPGVNRIGRSLNTDFQISHPSVSSAHCEIAAAEDGWTVKDLGSTNGTLLDGKPVRESLWQRGQTLRLGEVEIVFTPENALSEAVESAISADATEAALSPEPPAGTAPRRVSADVALPPPMPGAPANSVVPRIRAGAKPAVRPGPNFFAVLPGAFAYPFRRNGLILLLAGAIFFVVLNFLSRWAGIVGLILGVFCGGYLFSFLKTVITTTAMGEEELPDWPEYDSWMESGLTPFLEMAGVFVVCLGPWLIYRKFVTGYQPWVAWALCIGGISYMPMALLALAMYDTLLALNPVLILPSILRAPVEYAATCLVLGLLALGSVAAQRWLNANANVPVLAPVVGEFLLLYTLTVVMRVAGLLYCAKKDRLHWKLAGK